MNQLLGVLRELGDRAPPSHPRAASIPAHGVDAGTRPRHRPSDCPARRACLEPLARLVSLEIPGNFASMGIDPDQVFEAQLGALTV